MLVDMKHHHYAQSDSELKILMMVEAAQKMKLDLGGLARL
jgi:hypothetical protein